MKCPCSTHCAERTFICHDSCQQYIAWHESIVAEREKRREYHVNERAYSNSDHWRDGWTLARKKGQRHGR